MRKILSLALAALALCACSLEENPTSFPVRERYWNNAGQCRSALNGCYLPMASIYAASYLFVTEACTDIWHSNSTTVDACLDVTPAKPQFGATVWRQGYLGVMRCNECIECIGRSELADSVKAPMMAEARVLRALYYYNLTCMFGGVPFYTYFVEDGETMAKVRTLPRTDAAEIRSAIYKDLKDNAIPYFTEGNGLKVRASEAPSQRVGYALGLMLMAKMALWDEDYTGALEPLQLLEELYGEFSEERYPLNETMWRYKNTAESILEIQHDWSADGVQYAGNVACIMMPSSKMSDTEPSVRLYDGIEVPELGNNASSWSGLVANWHYGVFRPDTGTEKKEHSSIKGLFDPLPLTYDDEYNDEDGRWYVKYDTDALASGTIRGKKIDRRVYLKFGLGNPDSGQVFNTVRRYGLSCAGRQFWCPGITLSYDSNNYKVFRYADAILMIAECQLGLGNTDDAMEYINKVRVRAGIDPINNNAGVEALTSVLRSERAKELGGEFQRKFDLVRWGIWYEETYTFNTNSKLKDRMKPCHRYYPIPDTQCALSGRVLTNDEYIAYGM